MNKVLEEDGYQENMIRKALPTIKYSKNLKFFFNNHDVLNAQQEIQIEVSNKKGLERE